jgi:hypothetical protein
MADKIRRELESSTFRNPAQQTAFETLYQKQVEEDVSNGLHAEWLLSDDNDGPPPPVDREKLLNDTAPGLIPALARSGRLSDALDMFHRLSDPEIIKDSLEKVLPFWVEADPDGAMAALNAAPLTELERDRLKKLPVFLLHPDKKAPNP